MNTAVIFATTNYNKYSVAALAGAIESTLSVADIPLYFIESRDIREFARQVKELRLNHDTLIVCFSFATTNIINAYESVSYLRTAVDTENVTLIAGGPHATGDPEGTIRLGFDIVAIGEAEETLPELIDKIRFGGSLSSVTGIAYRDESGFSRTSRISLIDLDNYAPFSVKHSRLSPIEISRGCPHACRFCQTSFIFGGRMRHRSIEKIIRYMELSKSNGTRDFRFISPNALAYGSPDGSSVDLDRIENLLSAASQVTGVKHLFFGSFPSEVRPEAVSKDALDLIRKYTGTKQLVIGAQTGSQRMLDLLHREHTVGEVERAVALIQNAGIEVCVDFIFGLPCEADEDREASLALIDKLSRSGAKIHSHTFIPLPGTPLSGAEAGAVDDTLSLYLSRLANQGLQFGQWQKQQRLAKEATDFINNSS